MTLNSVSFVSTVPVGGKGAREQVGDLQGHVVKNLVEWGGTKGNSFGSISKEAGFLPQSSAVPLSKSFKEIACFGEKAVKAHSDYTKRKVRLFKDILKIVSVPGSIVGIAVTIPLMVVAALVLMIALPTLLGGPAGFLGSAALIISMTLALSVFFVPLAVFGFTIGANLFSLKSSMLDIKHMKSERPYISSDEMKEALALVKKFVEVDSQESLEDLEVGITRKESDIEREHHVLAGIKQQYAAAQTSLEEASSQTASSEAIEGHEDTLPTDDIKELQKNRDALLIRNDDQRARIKNLVNEKEKLQRQEKALEQLIAFGREILKKASDGGLIDSTLEEHESISVAKQVDNPADESLDQVREPPKQGADTGEAVDTQVKV